MVSISGFGQTGPDRDYVAYGANVEASCGLAAATGYADDDRPYRSTLFYADPSQEPTQPSPSWPRCITVRPLVRASTSTCPSTRTASRSFLRRSWSTRSQATLAKRRGNRHPHIRAPQGCYPSYGDDSWLALCVRTLEEWRGLTKDHWSD